MKYNINLAKKTKQNNLWLNYIDLLPLVSVGRPKLRFFDICMYVWCHILNFCEYYYANVYQLLDFFLYLCENLYMLVLNTIYAKSNKCETILVVMRNTLILDDHTCRHWNWSFNTTVSNLNSFVGLSHFITNLRYMPSNMFIFKFWTTFVGERKIRVIFFSVNACCELKSRLFDFFERFGKCVSWVQILFN